MRRGKALEVRLAAMHQTYLVRGVARIHKAHPEAKMVNGRMVYSAKGPPDFIGTIAGGRSVVFDAKESSGKTFRLGNVPPHQAKDMEACVNLGGLAFLYVHTTVAEWVLPWESIRELYWSGVKTLNTQRMDELGRRVTGTDWLEATHA